MDLEIWEIGLDVDARLHDLRGRDPALQAALDPDGYVESQDLGVGCGLEAPMASSTRASVAKAANALDSFIPTAPQIPFWGGASTITGTARGWIYTAI